VKATQEAKSADIDMAPFLVVPTWDTTAYDHLAFDGTGIFMSVCVFSSKKDEPHFVCVSPSISIIL